VSEFNVGPIKMMSDLPTDVSATEVLNTFPVQGPDVRYNKVAHIGQGSYANVYLVESSRSGRQYVLKEMDALSMTEQERGKALREVRILHQLKHPNIIGYKDSYLDADGFLCIIMEFADGGDVHQLLQVQKQYSEPFEEKLLLHWFAQILLALKYVHDHNLLHRDLKPQNLFVTQRGMIKLGDFGVSRILESECCMAKTQTGTPFYFSPELWLDEPYNRKSDMFALGSIMYELCMHNPPFHYEDMNMVRDGILHHEPQPISSFYSSELRALIAKMMSKDPSERPDCDAIMQLPFVLKEVLKLPWGRAQTTPANTRAKEGTDNALCLSQNLVADKDVFKERKEKKEKKVKKDKSDKKEEQKKDLDAIGLKGEVALPGVDTGALIYGGLVKVVLGIRSENENPSMEDVLRELLEDKSPHHKPVRVAVPDVPVIADTSEICFNERNSYDTTSQVVVAPQDILPLHYSQGDTEALLKKARKLTAGKKRSESIADSKDITSEQNAENEQHTSQIKVAEAGSELPSAKIVDDSNYVTQEVDKTAHVASAVGKALVVVTECDKKGSRRKKEKESKDKCSKTKAKPEKASDAGMNISAPSRVAFDCKARTIVGNVDSEEAYEHESDSSSLASQAAAPIKFQRQRRASISGITNEQRRNHALGALPLSPNKPHPLSPGVVGSSNVSSLKRAEAIKALSPMRPVSRAPVSYGFQVEPSLRSEMSCVVKGFVTPLVAERAKMGNEKSGLPSLGSRSGVNFKPKCKQLNISNAHKNSGREFDGDTIDSGRNNNMPRVLPELQRVAGPRLR